MVDWNEAFDGNFSLIWKSIQDEVSGYIKIDALKPELENYIDFRENFNFWKSKKEKSNYLTQPQERLYYKMSYFDVGVQVNKSEDCGQQNFYLGLQMGNLNSSSLQKFGRVGIQLFNNVCLQSNLRYALAYNSAQAYQSDMPKGKAFMHKVGKGLVETVQKSYLGEVNEVKVGEVGSLVFDEYTNIGTLTISGNIDRVEHRGDFKIGKCVVKVNKLNELKIPEYLVGLLEDGETKYLLTRRTNREIPKEASPVIVDLPQPEKKPDKSKIRSVYRPSFDYRRRR